MIKSFNINQSNITNEHRKSILNLFQDKDFHISLKANRLLRFVLYM